MSNSNLGPDHQAFIEDFADLMGHWGLPVTAARIYAFLLLCAEPATLDECAEGLGISKSNVSTAARLLLRGGTVKRIAERHTKRIRYTVDEDAGVPLRRHAELLGQMAALIAARKDQVATGATHDRLTALAAFHLSLKQAMETVL